MIMKIPLHSFSNILEFTFEFSTKYITSHSYVNDALCFMVIHYFMGCSKKSELYINVFVQFFNACIK